MGERIRTSGPAEDGDVEYHLAAARKRIRAERGWDERQTDLVERIELVRRLVAPLPPDWWPTVFDAAVHDLRASARFEPGKVYRHREGRALLRVLPLVLDEPGTEWDPHMVGQTPEGDLLDLARRDPSMYEPATLEDWAEAWDDPRYVEMREPPLRYFDPSEEVDAEIVGDDEAPPFHSQLRPVEPARDEELGHRHDWYVSSGVEALERNEVEVRCRGCDARQGRRPQPEPQLGVRLDDGGTMSLREVIDEGVHVDGQGRTVRGPRRAVADAAAGQPLEHEHDFSLNGTLCSWPGCVATPYDNDEDSPAAVARRVHATDDAMVWATEFCKITGGDFGGRLARDPGFMVGWFANAIETAKRIERERAARPAIADLLQCVGPERALAAVEHDDAGKSEEKCLRCGWVMGDPPLNCRNDGTPHVFPSQLTAEQLQAAASPMPLRLRG